MCKNIYVHYQKIINKNLSVLRKPVDCVEFCHNLPPEQHFGDGGKKQLFFLIGRDIQQRAPDGWPSASCDLLRKRKYLNAVQPIELLSYMNATIWSSYSI